MHFQKLIIPLALCLSLCLPAHAIGTEGTPETTPEVITEEVLEDDPVSVENPDDSGNDSDGDSVFDPDAGLGLYDDANLVGVDVYSLSPVTPDDTTGLKSVLLEFVGDYDPVIVEYEYANSNGYSNFLREVQPDYVWIASCCMLGLFVLSLFKLGGALLCRR